MILEIFVLRLMGTARHSKEVPCFVGFTLLELEIGYWCIGLSKFELITGSVIGQSFGLSCRNGQCA